ncbi:cation diffusion facilitator family transporter [Rhodomicrobium vannielii ATCC 17100]|uniref:Cation diffusion facilitator family transporter n=1 Tax=Rhodomicrobium vannielii (strain ATCC 17100 / DSM 162 / LMG 4299 / NCIMB 10020 / ATH 3.1.1) TaxID=648757 RepID=E3I310_RHOVT|nr:cation diffusion facilitator family transporter [Rhodomicrobium vannielii]ADP70304.1 cation diffusion facilitator family transporter [Rhodomicrobium vannielii ATCC 17100]
MHGHNHDSSHGHSHAHAHGHAPQNFQSAFAIAVGLNIALVAAQVVYGVIANSVALLADAGHNLSDVFGLLLAWGAATAAKKRPTERFTYGYRSTSILAALANAIILLIAVGAIALEAARRFFYPEPVAAGGVMIASAIGIVINGGTALLFMRGRHGDINIRGAYLHLAADAGVSVGVLLAAFLIWQTGWMWVDPLVSLAIAGVIVAGTWGLLRDSVNMALQAVPPGIDPVAVRRHLEALPGVACIHDLHIWAMSTTETALTCHLVMPEGHPGDAFIARAGHDLHEEFGIEHVTLQIERGDAESCALAPDNVV